MNAMTLSTEAMARIGDRLLGHHRAALSEQPLTSTLLGPFELAHKNLLTTQQAPSRADAEITRLNGDLADQDATHDRLARGIYRALSSWAELTDDPGERATVEALTEQLFPRGLRIIQSGWSETAGAARLLTARLDEDDLSALAQTRIAGATLKTHLQRWTDAASHLGALLDERDEHRAARAEAHTVGPAEVLAARRNWVRALNLLLDTMAFERGDDDPLLLKIRRELETLARQPDVVEPTRPATDVVPQ